MKNIFYILFLTTSLIFPQVNCFDQIEAGWYHSLGLKTDGTVVGWGGSQNIGDPNILYDEVNIPEGLINVTSIATGENHSLALLSDGTVVGWGRNDDGQVDIPDDLVNVIAIEGGSCHSLALKSNGSVVAWGCNNNGQTNIPEDLTNVQAISTNFDFSLALKNDGTVVGWGDNFFGQTDIPENLSNIISIAAGDLHSLALNSDGVVFGWGTQSFNLVLPEDIVDISAIEAGYRHSLALKEDGTVLAWGHNIYGGLNVPENLSNVFSISSGYNHALVLKSTNNTVEVNGWGANYQGQLNVLNFCDCDGNLEDCYGVCGGDSVIDECGECGGDGYYEDCVGSNNCNVMDACGNCGGDCTDMFYSSDLDGPFIECGYTSNAINNVIVAGCDGVCASNTVLDDCGVCGGNGIPEGACDCIGSVTDCAGECGGGAYVDECGQCMCAPNSDPDIFQCDDDNECEEGCDGIWYSDLGQLPVFDCSGVCGGLAVVDQCYPPICDDNPDNDNESCTGCTEVNACNFDSGAIFGSASCIYTDNICETCSGETDGSGILVDNDLDDDTVCNDNDICPGEDDTIDTDFDGLPDACDICPQDLENDADNDGVCESDEVAGCTDEFACNYSVAATDQDNSCTYTDGLCESCEDGVIVDNDTDDDMVCNSDDQCEGFDDSIDYDNDNIIDGCEDCVGIDTIDGGCVIYGDVNQDGFVGFDDAMVILSYLLESSGELLGMDYNQDGIVTLLDFTMLIYEYFSMDVSAESLENPSSAQIATFYNTINLFADQYVAGVLLSLENISDNFDLSIDSTYVSIYSVYGSNIKILFMDDPEHSDLLDTVLVDVISGTYELNYEETQIVDINSHIPFSVIYQLGDVNMDISINILDVVHMVEHILAIDPEINQYADINHDGVVNVMDVILLVYFIFDIS